MKWHKILLAFVLGASTTAWSGEITRVTVTPQTPSPSDEIRVKVSRWMPYGYTVVNSTLQAQGNRIYLDLEWVAITGVPEYHWQQHTESIGKWNPGTYTVVVSNNGTTAACTLFTVIAETSESASNSSAWSIIDQWLSGLNSNGESLADRMRKLFPTLWPW
jgi:hypothetical protein